MLINPTASLRGTGAIVKFTVSRAVVEKFSITFGVPRKILDNFSVKAGVSVGETDVVG